MRPEAAPSQDSSARRDQIIALFSLFKVGIITILLGFVVALNLFSPQEVLLKSHLQYAVLILVSVAFGSLIVTALVLKYRLLPARPFFMGVLFMDLLVTTILVHLTGGANSPYTILFLVPVIASAIIYSTVWSASFTFIALFLYFAVSIAGSAGWLPAVRGQYILPTDIATEDLVRRLSLNAAAFATVSALSIYLSRRLALTETVVETAKKEIIDLKFRHRDILNSLADGVLSLDGAGTILMANRAAERILGPMVRGEVHVRELGDEFREIFDLGLRDRRVVVSRDGQDLQLECSLTALKRSGKRLGHVLLIRDRTEQEKLEEEMARQNHLASLGRLSAGIAHEIRNPLASISGSMEMIRRELGEDISGDVAELFEIVTSESARLNGLIGDLLTYTRQRPINALEVDFGLFLYETLTLLRGDKRAQQKTLEFTLPDEEILALLEPDSMRQVVFNLVINALEMPTTRRVLVTLKAEPARCVLTVDDDGAGITEDAAEKLFEPFFTTKEQGTGLGLAIVSRLVEKHWGTVACDRSPLGGARFTVALPRELG